MMDKDSVSLRSNLTNNANVILTDGGETTGADGNSSLRAAGSETITTQTTSSEFVLKWGNRKRLRCMKIQVKDNDPTGPAQRTTVRVDRRVVRADKDLLSQPSGGHHGNGYLNLRQRHYSPQPPPPPPSQRILRNSDASGAMRGQSNGIARGIASPDRGGGAHDKRGNQVNNHSINFHHYHHHHHHNNHNENNKSAASSETAHDSKKGGGSSSGSGEAMPPVWPPKFVIALTNKEKEEDFMAIKGSKLPQRPKKRAKFIQRTLNLVSPGAWLCDLTLERYEVREKKISKKRPRGLKAMGNMDSDSE